MDYITFCKNYFATTRIPVNLVNDDEPLYSSLAELLNIPPTHPVTIYPADHNPEFRCLSPDIVFGSVHIEETDLYIMLGPCFSVPVTDEIVRQYMRDSATPLKYKEVVAEALASIPLLTPTQFSQHLVLLHQCLNHKEVTVLNLIDQTKPNHQAQEEQFVKSITENMEQEKLHNTYSYELELYRHIQDGNVTALKEFLTHSPQDLVAGKLAQTPLRQAKNLLIGTVTKVGMLGAIPGGVDVEKTYQLMDLYIQECEKLQSIEKIHALQYSMLIDFCQRAGRPRFRTEFPRKCTSA